MNLGMYMRGTYGRGVYDRPTDFQVPNDNGGMSSVLQGISIGQQQDEQRQRLQAQQFAMQQAQQGAQQKQQLNALASQAYTAPASQRSTLLGQMAAIDPTVAARQQVAYGAMDKDALAQKQAALDGNARAFSAIAQMPDGPQKTQAYNAMLDEVAQRGNDVSMFRNVGPNVGARMALAQIADIKTLAGMDGAGASAQPKVIDGALVSPTGQVIYRSPIQPHFDPTTGTLINTQDGTFEPVRNASAPPPSGNTTVTGTDGTKVAFDFPPGTPQAVIDQAYAAARANGDLPPTSGAPQTLAQYKAQNNPKHASGSNESDVLAPAPGNPALSGQAYIASLPDGIRSNAELIAAGKAPWPTGYVLRTAYGQQLIAAAHHINPNVDATSFPARASAQKSLAAGPLGTSNNAFSTALQHANAMLEANNAMGISNVPGIGWVEAKGESLDRNPAYNTFMAGRQPFASEMARAYKGGAPAEQEIQSYFNELDPSQGQKAIATKLGTYTRFLYDKALANARQYQQAMRRAGIPAAPIPQETMDAIDQSRALAIKAGVPESLLTKDSDAQHINQVTATPIPEPQNGSAATQGPIATNPQTGARVQWNGQAWVPLQ